MLNANTVVCSCVVAKEQNNTASSLACPATVLPLNIYFCSGNQGNLRAMGTPLGLN